MTGDGTGQAQGARWDGRLAELQGGLRELMQRRNNVEASLATLGRERDELGVLIARQEGAIALLREVMAEQPVTSELPVTSEQ